MQIQWKPWPLRAESEELLHLDMLRFLAATAIVIYHFHLQIDVPGWAAPLARLEALSLCVDLFFFISGYVITRFYGVIRDGGHYRGFMKKRFARLYPLHLATALVFVAIGLAYQLGAIQLRLPGQFDFRCLPANLLLLHSAGLCDHLSFNTVSWSISAEMLLYAALPMLLVLRRGGAWPALIAAGAILAALMITAGPDSARPWYSWTYDYGFLRALPSFLLGMGCFDARKTIARLPHADKLLWSLSGLFVLLLIVQAPDPVLLITLYGVGIAGVAADQQKNVSGAVRRLAPLGLLTYSIYMLHPVVGIVAISFVGKKVLGLGGEPLALWIGFCFLLTFAISWVSFQMFETPARRWIARDRSARKGQAFMPPVDRHSPL